VDGGEPVADSLRAVATLLQEQLDGGAERLARVRHLDRAVSARLRGLDRDALPPAARVFLRRLLRSVLDLERLDADERLARLRRTLLAVRRAAERGFGDDGPEGPQEPERRPDAPMRDVVSDLAVPVEQVAGVGPVTRDALLAAGIRTVADLLQHLPRAYQDRSTAARIADLKPGDEAVVFGTVQGVRSGRGRRMRFVEVAVADGSGTLLATWFRPPPHLVKGFREGSEIALMGKLEKREIKTMSHPEFELGGGAREGEGGHGLHRGVVVPLYTLPLGIGQRGLRRLVATALRDFAEALPDALPPGLRARLGLPSRAEALRILHFPDAAADLPALGEGRHAAHEALLLEDLFLLQVALLRRREALRGRGIAGAEQGRAARGAATGARSLRERALLRLPFELSSAQGRALLEIDGDLSGSRPMQRLLQGDVGSGKTVVALLAMGPLIERGLQAAVLAPTEVLAWQWHARAKELYGPFGVDVALLTGGQGGAARKHQRAQVRDGRAGIVVGTHAIFQEGVEFRALALSVVDEQQRFGVFERAQLMEKGPAPHLLAMTATPIPRSLALTIFGDLDVSVIDERPPRGVVDTLLLPAPRRHEAWAMARDAVEAGGRVYVVCPRVDGPAASEGGRAAVPLAEELAAGELAGLRLGVLHGRMDAASKERTLERFRGGEIDVLVGTTVVEVGVDVPEATLMVVEDADRFGLAQLHQLRGRVGRSERGGRCVLLAERREELPRLQVLLSTDDGFRIAEEDLRLRGPGDLVGARQSGAPAFRLCTTPRFVDLLRCAREEAARVAVRADYENALDLGYLRAATAARMEAARAGTGG
jgi:ATP-dependent DNA helicase RecG